MELKKGFEAKIIIKRLKNLGVSMNELAVHKEVKYYVEETDDKAEMVDRSSFYKEMNTYHGVCGTSTLLLVESLLSQDIKDFVVYTMKHGQTRVDFQSPSSNGFFTFMNDSIDMIVIIRDKSDHYLYDSNNPDVSNLGLSELFSIISCI